MRARKSERSTEQRLRIGRRICVGGALVELALCIALVCVMPSATGVLVAVIGGGMGATYNVVLWRTINRQAARQESESASMFSA